MPRGLALSTLCTLLFLTACSDSGDSRYSQVPLTPLLERYILSSEDSIPEGVAFDPWERNFYASSLESGGIVRISADGMESAFLQPAEGISFGGIKVDNANRLLWTCGPPATGETGFVSAFDLDSGEVEFQFLLGAITTKGICNDVALDSAGVVYATNPRDPFVYRLDPATEEGEVLVSDPRFTDITGVNLGLNGLAVTPDNKWLIIARFATPALFRVPLPAADEVREITLSGDTFPFPDGLAFLEGDLYSVSNASVSRVRFNADYSEGQVVSVEQIDGLSTATVAEGQLYVIKSEVTQYALEAPLQLPFEIFSVDLQPFGE